MKTNMVSKSTLILPTLSRRRTLHANALGLVEDFQLSGDCAAPGEPHGDDPEQFSAHILSVVPIDGV